MKPKTRVEEHLHIATGAAKYCYRMLGSNEVTFEDLKQEAIFGLINADKTFDESKGLAFGTYAYLHCVWEGMEYARGKGRAVNLRWGGKGIKNICFSDVMEKTIKDSGMGYEDTTCVSSMFDEAITKGELTTTETIVINMRREGHTLQEIGNKIGRTRQRAEQHEKSAIKKMKPYLTNIS